MGRTAGRGKIPKTSDKIMALFLLWRLRKEPACGYGLVDEICDLGVSSRGQSTVYSVLSKLEKAGLIRGSEERVGKRVRRIYKTTAEGNALLKKVKATRIKGLFREFIGYLLS